MRSKICSLLTAGTAALMSAGTAYAGLINLSQIPLFLSSSQTPNVLVVMDNSESMDGTMAGTLIAGNDPTTRGNIGRGVIRNTISNYRTGFNWGLMSYGLSGSASLYNTYAYYLGSSSGMILTDNCSGSPLVSPVNGNRCILNPQYFLLNGRYVTYDKSGDDADVNDVLYINWNYSVVWGLGHGAAGTTANPNVSYDIWNTHTILNTSWTSSAFSNPIPGSPINFTPTDAGFLPGNPPYTRMLFLPRAWGYGANISGSGTLNEAVKPDSTTHYNTLMSLLGSETNTATSELKNAALFTPLAGTLQSAKSYFAGATTPIVASCQKNFVVLVTDGLPTGKTNGTLYSAADRTNTLSNGTWTFGQAAQDAFNAVTALRSTTNALGTFDVVTYVIAMGDTVANPGAVAVMNQMANLGDTNSAYFASDQASFQTAIQSVAADIAARTASASAVSLNTTAYASSSRTYQARFNSGDWSGQLLSYPVNSNGSLGSLAWDAGQVLSTQNWSTGRVILTYKASALLGSQGIAFRWPANPLVPLLTELDLSLVTALNTSAGNLLDGFGSQRVQYIRGSPANESCGGLCIPQFRIRATSKLGDIVNSAPYYVGAPLFGYPDSFEATPYSSFYNANKNRTPMIYVGANDGMLHGFNANTGAELIAYIPSEFVSKLSLLTDPNYTHRYSVDGSPTSGDVYFNSAWHTILVGTLRAGGQSLFALDVTNPSTFSETSAAAKSTVLWEFNDNQDTSTNDPAHDATLQYGLGYTYSQPSIVKLNTGKWGVIIGNGYNNTEADGFASTSGYAALYILDAQTGAVIAKINTKSGSAATPNGLSSPTPIDTNGDGIVDLVYAGDLLGNVWKFDLSSTTASQWTVALKSGTTPIPLFTTSTGQAITERIEVGKHPLGGYMLLFGTGKYLESTDVNSTTGQAFYGIWDNLGSTTVSLASLQQQTVAGTTTAGSNTVRVTSNNVAVPTPVSFWSTHSGWYINLPTSGERQVTDPVLTAGKIIFTTLIPNTGQCNYGGNGWLMEMDAATGNHLAYAPFDLNNDLAVNTSDNVSYSGVSTPATGLLLNSIPSAPSIMLANQVTLVGLQFEYLSLSSGTEQEILAKAGPTAQGRVSWIQIR